MADRSITYLRPGSGGIRAYSDVVVTILCRQRPSWRIEVVTAGAPRWRLLDGIRRAREIGRRRTVVLAELGADDAATLWCLARLPRRVPVVVTVHDPGVVVDRLLRLRSLDGGPWPLPGIGLRLSRLAARTVEPWIVRRVLARAAVRLVLNDEVGSVLGLSVTSLPAPVFTDVKIAHEAPAPPVIAYLGYWSAAKGLDDLLAAYARLVPAFPDARFVLGGSGAGDRDPYGDRLRQRAAQIEGVEVPGFVPDDALDAFVRGLSALVLPYREDVPGAASGMLLRAQEAGVPVIATDVPALRSQVDAENVWLVRPGDVDALARAVAEVLSDPSAAEAAARREQDRVHRDHAQALVGERLAAVLAPWVAG